MIHTKAENAELPSRKVRRQRRFERQGLDVWDGIADERPGQTGVARGEAQGADAQGGRSQIAHEQKSFTDGRIVVVGNRARRQAQKRTDYLLR